MRPDNNIKDFAGKLFFAKNPFSSSQRIFVRRIISFSLRFPSSYFINRLAQVRHDMKPAQYMGGLPGLFADHLQVFMTLLPVDLINSDHSNQKVPDSPGPRKPPSPPSETHTPNWHGKLRPRFQLNRLDQPARNQA